MSDDDEFEFKSLQKRDSFFKKFMQNNAKLFGDYCNRYKITKSNVNYDEGTYISADSCWNCKNKVGRAYFGTKDYGFVSFYTGDEAKNSKKMFFRHIAKEITRNFAIRNPKYRIIIRRDVSKPSSESANYEWQEVEAGSKEFINCDTWEIIPRKVTNEQELTSSLKELIPLFCNYITQAKDISSGVAINNMPNLNERDYEDDMIKDAISLLQTKKNIILQGAPGTGKTYSTAALALAILGIKDVDLKNHKDVMQKYNELLIKFDGNGNVKKNGQIGFVTFHQSMDYEDFIEGFKPKKENDNVVYGIEDGVFKGIVELAISNYEDSKKTEKELKIESDTKNLFEQFCLEIEKKLLEGGDVPLNSSSKMKIRGVNRRTDGTAKSISLSTTSSSTQQTLTLDIVLRDYPKYKNKEIKIPNDIKPKYESTYSSHGNASYYFELYKKMADFEKKVSISGETQSNKFSSLMKSIVVMSLKFLAN